MIEIKQKYSGRYRQFKNTRKQGKPGPHHSFEVEARSEEEALQEASEKMVGIGRVADCQLLIGGKYRNVSLEQPQIAT
jgi:hypothetical protein